MTTAESSPTAASPQHSPTAESPPAPTSRRRRWRRRLLVTTLFVSLFASAWSWLKSDPKPVGAWRSLEGRGAYLDAYEEVLANMPRPVESHDVETSYGTVHVVRFGEADGTPVLLMPGWGSGIPMWQQNLPSLMAERTVYAVDALGDAGRSTQTIPLDSAAAQAAWVAETITGLGLDRVHVVGHSFGGWSAANLALHQPQHVASLSLFDPVQTFSTLRWQIYLWSIPASVPFLPQSWRDAALARIGGAEEIDKTDPLVRMVDAGTKHFVSRRSFPTQLSDEQLRSLSMPVYAAMAQNGTVNGDPDGAVTRARDLVPDIQIEAWPGASHSLPMEDPERVAREVLAFMTAAE